MIYPENLTNFNRTDYEIEEYFLFCVIVSGKNALVQSKKLEEFLTPGRLENLTPFQYIKKLESKGILRLMLQEAKLGQHNRIYNIFKRCVRLDLRTVTAERLGKIPGIGPKTSRFFILHSRSNQNYAILDTHLLRWMREELKIPNVPSSTPQSQTRYTMLENIFLEEARTRNISPETLDLAIWNKYSKSKALAA